jgi:hypothetical protein
MDEGENLPQQDRQTTIISKESGYKRHAICDSRDALAIYLFVGARQQIVKSGPSLTAQKELSIAHQACLSAMDQCLAERCWSNKSTR